MARQPCLGLLQRLERHTRRRPWGEGLLGVQLGQSRGIALQQQIFGGADGERPAMQQGEVDDKRR
jgi:hypothetical protein